MAKPKLVTFVTVNYAPEPSGTAPYTSAAAEHLADQGCDVVVVTGLPHYPSWRLDPRYSGLRGKTEYLRGVKVRRHAHFVPTTQSAFSRTRYEVSFVIRAARTVLLRRSDMYVAVVPSLLSAALTAVAAKMWRAELLIWLQDSVHRGSTQSGISSSKAMSLALRLLEGWTLRRADKIIAINQRFVSQIEHLGVPPHKIALVRNWSFIPRPAGPPAATRRRYGWSSRDLVAVHAGNMGKKQGLGALVEAARCAHLGSSPLRLVFVGDGSQGGLLRRQAADLPNVQFLGTLSDQEYADVLHAADVLLVCEERGVLDMSLPSKLASYFASGKSVVAYVDQRGGTAAEISRSKAGLVIDNHRDPLTIVREVEALGSDRGHLDALGRAGLEFAEKTYPRTRSLAAIADLVQKGQTECGR